MHSGMKEAKQRCLDSDVIIYYRFYHNEVAFIQKMRALGKLAIYDIDDFVFQVNGRFNSYQEVAVINSFFENVNCYMASTEKLLEQMPTNDTPRFVRTNAIDQETYDLLSSRPIVKKNSAQRFKIGWLSGINRTEMHEFAMLFLRHLERTKTYWEFGYFGKMDKFYRFTQSLKFVKVRRYNYINTGKYKDLYKTFQMCQFDVVINPLDESDLFMQCKSHLKAIECGGLGYPLITSRVHPFIDILKEGETGYFASSHEEFVNKCIHARNHPEQLENIRRNTRAMVREKFLVKDQVDHFVKNCFNAIEINKHRKSNQVKIIEKSVQDYIPDIAQENFGYVTGEVLRPMTHEFICRKPGLCRLEFLGSTMSKRINAPLKVIIKNRDTDTIVLDKVYNIQSLQHNSWWGFEFQPRPDSRDCTFETTFIPLNPRRGGSIQFYFNFMDIPNKGRHFISGEKQRGCLAFKSYCSRNITQSPKEQKPSIVAESETKVTHVVGGETKGLENKPRVLLKLQGNMSDVLQLTTIARELKRVSPCEIITATPHRHVFENNPYIDETYDFNTPIRSVGQKFVFENYAFNEAKSHPQDAYGKVVFGHSHYNKELVINHSKEDEIRVNDILTESGLEEGRFVVFHEGIVFKNRTWPKEKWGRLEAHCLAQGIRVVVIGMGSDATPKMPKSVNLVNMLTIHQIKCLIQKAKVLVAIDGDMIQIGGATDTPMIPIMFSTIPILRLPYRQDKAGHHCYPIIPNMDCQGCWHGQVSPQTYYGCHRKDFACMNRITPKAVLDRINHL